MRKFNLLAVWLMALVNNVFSQETNDTLLILKSDSDAHYIEINILAPSKEWSKKIVLGACEYYIVFNNSDSIFMKREEKITLLKIDTLDFVPFGLKHSLMSAGMILEGGNLAFQFKSAANKSTKLKMFVSPVYFTLLKSTPGNRVIPSYKISYNYNVECNYWSYGGVVHNAYDDLLIRNFLSLDN